jgi:alpha-methylacyl-CoA racemase
MNAVSDSAGPLTGVRVLDLGTVGPGARACRILGDLGASVTRVVAPAGIGTALPFYAYSAMRGVRRCGIDLRTDQGKAATLDLAVAADVVVEGFRPGVADRLGVGYHAVHARNARVVYCAASGYGQHGPRATWAGHDLNYLAVTGFLHAGERAGDRPTLPGATVADAAGGGMHAALAVLAALFGRANDPEQSGCYLDVAATDGMLGLMAMPIEEQLATGSDPGPLSGVLSGRYACYGLYECADGGWLSVAAVEAKFFDNLCRELDCPELAALQYDDDRQDQVRLAHTTTFATRDRDDWVARLADHDTCVAPVLSVAEATHDAHHRSRGLFATAQHRDRGSFGQLGAVWAGSVPPSEPVVLPADDQFDTDAVLGELGYTADRLRALRAAGAIR